MSTPSQDSRQLLRDLWALTKPGVTRMCLLTTLGGALLAPGAISWSSLLGVMVGAWFAVAGANAFNMWWERETDKLMARTANRPLPKGRLQPATVLIFASVLSFASLVVLLIATNVTTALLAAFAILSYVLIYTPLKYKTSAALVIGAIPGAVPPLLGWTAATGELGAPGVILFGILLIWQIPHFIAIALMRKADYARAGIRCLPIVRGDAMAKIQAVVWATLLVPTSLMLTPLGVTGVFYTVSALVLGMGFAAWGLTGFDQAAGPKWARGFFFASLVYLPALALALVLDATFYHV